MLTKCHVALATILIASLAFAQAPAANTGGDRVNVLSPAFVERNAQSAGSSAANKAPSEAKSPAGPRTVNPLTGSTLAMEARRQTLAELDLEVQIAQKRKALKDLGSVPSTSASSVARPTAPAAANPPAAVKSTRRAVAAAGRPSVAPVAMPFGAPSPASAASPPVTVPRLVAISAGKEGWFAVVEQPGRTTVNARANSQHGDLLVGDLGPNHAVLNGRRVELAGHGTILSPTSAVNVYRTPVGNPSPAPSPLPTSTPYAQPLIGAPLPVGNPPAATR